MALDALLASLAADAAARDAALLDAARADAAARQAEAAAARDRRAAEAILRRRAVHDGALETAVAAARQSSEREVLLARDEVLARIRARAHDLLASSASPAATAAADALLRAAATYLEAGGSARASPPWIEALGPTLRARGLVLVPDEATPPGTRLASADGRLAIDATLPTLLDRRWPDEAIRLAAALADAP
jgi:vacuolar-type H+-ATPase subunit E/Vma4